MVRKFKVGDFVRIRRNHFDKWSYYVGYIESANPTLDAFIIVLGGNSKNFTPYTSEVYDPKSLILLENSLRLKPRINVV